mgnify:CR=1 FL=1
MMPSESFILMNKNKMNLCEIMRKWKIIAKNVLYLEQNARKLRFLI